MEAELNGMHIVGIWLMVTGLILNTLVFTFSYYKVAVRLKELREEVVGDEKEDEEEKKRFPIVRFVIHFRKFLRELQEDNESKDNFELVMAFLKWILLLAICMILVGLLLFLCGFLF